MDVQIETRVSNQVERYLDLAAGASLIISNNVQVYFINSNPFSQAQVICCSN